ncbi:SDR family oxidoreductase [Shewanella baltica]|uniref:SDR family oxidoreductase n=1 Tax=Shewanella baltica TaxID=62322 RepID=UPI000230D24B|nr:SDR family oxidoreductase [Shewanella baltica]EHC04570.1 short-chain dehydrogenase/reductase SDR [Shewanella baltica OS625]MCS6177991.1 SDR family oxidoreductase [Shewanella baltica]MCS6254137.1 SDR family oxidoreductase [Shewanella baltica]
MKVLIVGGSGGIGQAMVKQVQETYPDATVHATYRHHLPQDRQNNIQWHALDVTNEAEIKQLSEQLTELDWLINCVGILHTQDKGPEKSLQSLDIDFFQHNLTLNTLPSVMLAKHFCHALKQSDSARFAVISAKVGSITDNRLGGWYSYRASKAALNMFLKTLSIEWQRNMKHCVVLSLHPGTTDTPLSQPFQQSVPQGKLFTPEYVANCLLPIIANATPAQTGCFFAYDGTELPW